MDEETNLYCCAWREIASGAWIGYVGVPPEHKYYKKAPTALSEKIQGCVHGGVIIGDFHYGDESMWVFSFDALHKGDHQPALHEDLRNMGFGKGSYIPLKQIKESIQILAYRLSTE